MTPVLSPADVVRAARRVYADHGASATLGAVTLDVEGGRYRMRGPQGTHSIAAEPEITSMARLVAHLAGFVGVVGVERTLREHPAVDAAPTARRAVPRRGPGGVTYTPAAEGESALITLPFGRGQATLEAVLACEELAFPGYELTPAQLRWLDRVADEVMGEDADDTDD